MSAPQPPRRLPDAEPPSRVVVVGDLMLDVLVQGEAGRLSPEAPVPVLLERSASDRPGGAANVAANLAALGAHVDLVGAVGRDAEATRLRRVMLPTGVGVSGWVEVEGRPTTVKTRLVARRQQVARLDREETSALPEGATAALAASLGVVQRAGVVVVADYGKGVVSPALWDVLVQAARRAGARLLVDPNPHADIGLYRGADLLKPNEAEARRAAERLGAPHHDLDAVAAALRNRSGAAAVVITRGERGLSVFPSGGPHLDIIPVRRREVFDVTGAGDTVLAALAWALAAGEALEDAAALANLAGGLAVERFGTSCISRRDLERALLPEADLYAKLVPRSDLAERLAEMRHGGRRIVFTNGCFDLLHVGHLRLIKRCAEFGEVVVVGLNSDASVRRLKGEGRPVLPERDRALLLAALPEVQLVTVFEEDTPSRLIQEVRPDVLVKGADYAPGEVVGREEVEAAGGRLELVSLFEGVSTSEILRRIRTPAAKRGSKKKEEELR